MTPRTEKARPASTLALLAGVYDPVSIDAEGLATLIDESANFLRAGGVVSMTEWCALSPAERAALVEASTIILSERAAVYGFAAQGPAAAARVGSRADGGEMSRAMALRAVVEATAARAAKADSSIPVEAAP